jgi:hypothetical protein
MEELIEWDVGSKEVLEIGERVDLVFDKLSRYL